MGLINAMKSYEKLLNVMKSYEIFSILIGLLVKLLSQFWVTKNRPLSEPCWVLLSVIMEIFFEMENYLIF